MNIAFEISFAIALAAMFLLAYFVRKAIHSGQDLPVTSEWIEDLTFDRYRPMLRILDGSDIEFLRSQPDFTPGMAIQLRAQRSKIFRSYLTSLEADFSRVCLAIKLVISQSRHDRPNLAETLLRHQITFACSMLAVRLRLVLYSRGFCSVDVSTLVRMFESMRLEVRALVPVTSSLAS